jgi:alpha-galactosidase
VAVTNNRLTTIDHPYSRKLFQQYGHLCLYGLFDQGTCRSPKYAFDAQAQLSHTTLKYGILFHGVLLTLLTWSANPL